MQSAHRGPLFEILRSLLVQPGLCIADGFGDVLLHGIVVLFDRHDDFAILIKQHSLV